MTIKSPKFYTQKVGKKYTGHSYDYPVLKYGPVATRDAAMSGIRREAKKVTAALGELKSALSKIKTPDTLVSKPQLSTKRKVNRVAFLIDRSGSMSGVSKNVVDALNNNIAVLLEQTKLTGQTTLVSVYTFDDEYEKIRDSVPVQLLVPVSQNEFSPRGNTGLYDAVGRTIEQFEDMRELSGDDVTYLVITITDGAENASRRFNTGSISTKVRTAQATDRFTFTFLVPPRAKDSIVRQFGVHAGNVSEWEATAAGVQAYTTSNNAGLKNYYATRSAGGTYTDSFYTDLSKLTPNKVKKDLDDLSSLVKVLPVDKEQDIKSFVEGKLGQYNPGTAFYQLTKDEKKVQDYKQLLVMEKGKRQVFGGPDARQVLGIPDGNLKIKPGNHGNFDIFVQSNSLNRKLVRGTKLLVRTK